MSMSDYYSFIRYLQAKKDMDDKALNRFVWQRLREALEPLQTHGFVKILEVGCGIGTMVERMLDGGLLTRATYTGIDVQPTIVAEAKTRLRRYASERGLHTKQEPNGLLSLRRYDQEAGQKAGREPGQEPDQKIVLEFLTSDVADFASRQDAHRAYHLILGHAFLDLVDLDSTLSLILTTARPEGLLYFTLTFDGATIFEPQIDPILDEKIEMLYHEDMDLRCAGQKPSQRPSQGTSQRSRTGRRLLARLLNVGASILAAGSSDWIVHPGPDGYSPDEVYFLHFIIETIRGALAGKPGLDQTAFSDWVAKRHQQIEQGDLIYIAHQIDVLALAPDVQ